MLMLYTRALIGLKSVFTQELYIIVQIVYLRIRSDPRQEASASLFVMPRVSPFMGSFPSIGAKFDNFGGLPSAGERRTSLLIYL